MLRPLTLTLASLGLTGCLPWVDGYFDLSGEGGSADGFSNSDPMGSTDGSSNSDSVDPTSGAGPGGDNTTTPATSAGTTHADTTSGLDTSPPETDTGTGTDGAVCLDAGESTPALAFTMKGLDDIPAVAAGPDCQTYMTGELGDWDGCTGFDLGSSGAYMARLHEDGSCQHVVHLPGQRGSDVALLGDDVVVVAGEGPGMQPALLALVGPDNKVQLSNYTGVGSHARALAVTNTHIFVAGACPKTGDDPLWLARFDHTLGQVLENDCGTETLLEARAIAASSDRIYVVGRHALASAYVAVFDQDLQPLTVIELGGVDPDLGKLANHRAAIVSSPSKGVYLAVGCEGPEFLIEGAGSVACENMPVEAGGNIALVRLNDLGAHLDTLVFGGISAQHVTALALADESTLVMTGTFDGSISLSPPPELSVSNAVGGYSFIAWFDISVGTPVPKDLWVVDHGKDSSSMAFDLAVNVGAPADAERVLVAGSAAGNACIRRHSDGACDPLPIAAGGQNFLASLPLAP